MRANRPPLDEQVLVITGASSGIGLSTARLAAARGAKLVLVARSEDAIETLAEEITTAGGDAVPVVADVSNRDDVREITRVATAEYGSIDTWINGAAVSIYGRLTDVPVADMRDQFETNVWGVVYGSLEAREHFAKHDKSGAILNIGSIVSDRSLILQGSYSASKHAVKAFTDTLRMELEADGEPIAVTLIKPGAMDTPYPIHAKNYLDTEPTLPPPVYAPETTARAILRAAQRPQRDVIVGGGGKFMVSLATYAPRLMDRIMERYFIDNQHTDRPPRLCDENGLERPVGDLEERGNYDGFVAERSLYTTAAQRGILSELVIFTLAITAAVIYKWYNAIQR